MQRVSVIFSWPFALKRVIHLFQFFRIATHYCKLYFHQKLKTIS